MHVGGQGFSCGQIAAPRIHPLRTAPAHLQSGRRKQLYRFQLWEGLKIGVSQAVSCWITFLRWCHLQVAPIFEHLCGFILGECNSIRAL